MNFQTLPAPAQESSFFKQFAAPYRTMIDKGGSR